MTDRENAGITCPDEFVRIAKVQAPLWFDLGVLQAAKEYWSQLHVVKRELKVHPVTVEMVIRL